LRAAKAEGTFLCGLAEKTWCLLVFIPVLVFDCVALRFREGISGRFPERMGTCFSYALDNFDMLLIPLKHITIQNFKLDVVETLKAYES